jgi:hypothetical protein
MKIEQFVMAYGVDHDRLRAIIPEGFTSLRPVLRINGEIRGEKNGYVEFNTPVSHDGNKGWLNIAYWNNVPFTREGKKVTFQPDFLTISFTGVGIQGSCPAEKDNAGCYFLSKTPALQLPEVLTANKEFCDCEFAWHFADGDAHGVSIRETLPAFPAEVTHVYPKQELTPENAAAIPCNQVLGTYQVTFERE